MKKLSLKIILFFCIICLFSCKDYWTLPQDHHLMIEGIKIGNFPKWLNGFEEACYGFSDWLDWQGEQGQKLHKYVEDSIISDDYKGQFRILVTNQQVKVFVNDLKPRGQTIFYNYLWKKKHYAQRYDYPQADIAHSFIYDCYAKRDLYKDETEQDKAHVEMTLISSTSISNIYRYKQEICGEIVIDVELKNNSRPEGAVVSDLSKYEWLPFCTESDILYASLDFEDYENIIRFNGMYCYEGISLRDIDDIAHEISFNLLEDKKYFFADYFTLKVYKEELRGELTFYKEINGIPQVILVDNKHKLFYR